MVSTRKNDLEEVEVQGQGQPPCSKCNAIRGILQLSERLSPLILISHLLDRRRVQIVKRNAVTFVGDCLQLSRLFARQDVIIFPFRQPGICVSYFLLILVLEKEVCSQRPGSVPFLDVMAFRRNIHSCLSRWGNLVSGLPSLCERHGNLMYDAVIVILEPVLYNGYGADVRLVFEAIEGKKNRIIYKLKEARGTRPIQ